MKTKKYYLQLLSTILLVIVGSMHAKAQDFENYVPLRCSGKVPEDFKKNATDKYLAELEKIEKSKDKERSAKRTEKEFSLSTSFQINDLLFSGRVLFGDPTSEYVNKVADILLANDKELRSKLRFYVIKSDVVNAFTTHQGIIFINLGLLAQVNSEAELAFVISHEIAHFTKNHVLEGYLEKEKIKKGKENYRNMGIDERVEELFKYSKDNENEADIEGFELYKKSAYSLKAIVPLFDVLLYSYLPFDEIEFNYDFMNDKYFKLPKKYKLAKDKIKEITAKEDEDDKESTHPNIRKRKDKIEELLADEKSNKNTALYLVGESEFKNVQKLARFEVCHIYLTVGKYAKALYSGWLLKNLYTEQKYADKVILMAMYGLKKSDQEDESLKDDNTGSEEDEDSEPSGTWKKIEGNSQPVYYMLNRFTNKELTIVASGLAWKYRQLYPGDVFIKKTADDLIKELVLSEELTAKSFDLESVASDTKTEEVDTISNEKLTKSEKIKKKKKSSGETTEGDKKFWRGIFMALSDKEKGELKKCFSKYKTIKEDNEKITFEQKEEARKKEDKARKKESNYGPALGIDKIVMMNPEYIYLEKDGYKYNQNLLRSESGMIYTENTIKEISKAAGLDLIMLDKKDEELSILNNININNQITSWITEKLKYDDTATVLFNSQYTDDLLSKTGTEHLGIAVVKSAPSYVLEGKAKNACLMGAGAIINPLCLGWGIYGSIWGNKGYTQYTFALFNLKTNKVEYVDYQEIYSTASKELIGQLLYKSLMGIKRTN